jgi:serine/threonine-protein kinase
MLASVLARDPDLTLLPPNINPRLIRLLQRCLNKEAKSRWHAIADVRVEMESILDEPMVAPQDAHARRPLRSLIVPVLMAGLVFSAITALVVLRLRPAPAPADITRFPYVLPESQAFSNPGRHLVAISSDGTEVVYIANQRLYLRLLSGNEARPIPGTESASNGVTDPAFSPDGKSVVFWSAADQTLKRIAVTGGAAVTICPADNLS